ncbi:MAG: hypothetical protein AAF730_13380 [Bacteroidota bacterium]
MNYSSLHSASRTWRNRFASALMVLLTLTLVACDSTDADDDLPPEEQGVESGILLSLQLDDADADATFMTVYEEIPSEVSLEDMIEIGDRNARAFPIGDEIFVFDGNGVYTKYTVDRTTLEISVAGQLDLTGLGIEGELGNPVPISEDVVYLVAYLSEQVIKFDPSNDAGEPEIIEVIPFQRISLDRFVPFASDNVFTGAFRYERIGDKIVAAIVNTDVTDWTSPFESQLFVFDIPSETVTYTTDNRLSGSNFLMVELEDGTFMTYPNWVSSGLVAYGQPPTPAPSGSTGLRVLSDGSTDPNFAVDFEQAIGGGGQQVVIDTIPFVFGNEALVIHWEPGTDFPANSEDWQDFFGNSTTRSLVNLQTGAVRPFNSLSQYQRINPMGVINGDAYYSAPPNSVDRETTPWAHVRQDGTDSFTIVHELPLGTRPRTFVQLWGPNM